MSHQVSVTNVCTLCLLLTTQNLILASPGFESSGDVQNQGVGVPPARMITTVQSDY